MFAYTHTETQTANIQKETKQNIRGTTPIYPMQNVRITPKHLTETQNILQRKSTANYLNPLPSGQTRHHIIPDSILKKFIAKIKNNDPATYLKLITAVEESYIHYHGITQDELTNPRLSDINYIRSLPSSPRNKFLVLINYTKENDLNEYQEEMKHAFIWSPGNIVIGPTNRTANPDDNFDSEAAKIAGIPMGTPRNSGTHTAPTGQMALSEVLSMMLYYNDGTINQVDDNIIDTILIPHIKRAIFDGTGATWK